MHTTPVWVAADSKVSAVAGSICHSLRAQGRVTVQAIGASAVNQATKAIAKATVFMAEDRQGIASHVEMVEAKSNGAACTAVRWTVVTV